MSRLILITCQPILTRQKNLTKQFLSKNMEIHRNMEELQSLDLRKHLWSKMPENLVSIKKLLK